MEINEILKSCVFAAPLSLASREQAENPPVFRSDFQRDRDRILYSKSFRRLSGKTQVFLTRTNDHVRNRLTHSLEVSQISCTTSKMLGLDLELTEAIALGHDIGHTPFGHVGERTLNLIMNNCIKLLIPDPQLAITEKGFKHNLQGVRIFVDLHRIYPTLKGTNLTNFTLYGIANHSNLTYGSCENFNATDGKCYKKMRVPCHHKGSVGVGFYDRYFPYMHVDKNGGFAWSFESNVVAFADEISQRHHDVEDAYLMNILSPTDIIDKILECFGEVVPVALLDKLKEIGNEKDFFAPLISQFLVNMYNSELIKNTMRNFECFASTVSVKSREDFVSCFSAYSMDAVNCLVGYGAAFTKADKCFHSFLRGTILNSHRAQRMDGKGSYLIERLFKAYFTNPRQLHDSTILAVFNRINNTMDTLNTVNKPVLGKYRNQIASSLNRSNPDYELILLRAICDHIAGMTDNFVIEEHSRLYGDGAI